MPNVDNSPITINLCECVYVCGCLCVYVFVHAFMLNALLRFSSIHVLSFCSQLFVALGNGMCGGGCVHVWVH